MNHFPPSALSIRPIRPAELPQLEEFLYQAVFVPEGEERPGREIVRLPELEVYYRDFGRREGDFCLVVENAPEFTDDEARLLGAVWIRVFDKAARGFGFVDEATPELSMSVLEGYRGRGLGTELLRAMLQKLAAGAYRQVSLSVDLDNYAYAWYQGFGFVQISSDGHSAIMLKRLS
ncbi:MAG TPA: GNAT family N-acetyltransferase [Bacteroidales bacterium]|jgi:ribosomal protein S18 acetylase RimI-like enzyme|nr:MAG: Mycothiol acetyltransferase [Bacteroidetes bacterium ADurb.Bin090]HOD27061.1 GNAT family N-acetyltransferase [Bacteroidales bacterium]HQM93556.1 GNAT family N-acetyltransferase [Bacteroidales bacterium]